MASKAGSQKYLCLCERCLARNPAGLLVSRSTEYLHNWSQPNNNNQTPSQTSLPPQSEALQTPFEVQSLPQLQVEPLSQLSPQVQPLPQASLQVQPLSQPSPQPSLSFSPHLSLQSLPQFSLVSNGLEDEIGLHTEEEMEAEEEVEAEEGVKDRLDTQNDPGCLDDLDDDDEDENVGNNMDDDDDDDDEILSGNFNNQMPALRNNADDESDNYDKEKELVCLALKEMKAGVSRWEMKNALSFIQQIQEATLESQAKLLGQDIVDCLCKNPKTSSITLSQDERLSVKLFLACNSASQDVYHESRKAVLERHPNDPILSYNEVKSLVVDVTGVIDIREDMCPSSCTAFTGPFQDMTKCPYCNEERYDKISKKPRLQFNTIPLGPQLQALKRNYTSAKAMNYLDSYMQAMIAKLEKNNGTVSIYDDILAGSELIEAYQDGRIKSDDIVLMFSFDGAQLYKNKESDCWLGQFVIVNLAPNERYKINAVRPAFTIPGPNKPKNLDSFFFTTLAHVSALQKEGFCLWDVSKNKI
ncbi:hypothetical protein H0H92_002921, partial [Tricholoma furcatifolium]